MSEQYSRDNPPEVPPGWIAVWDEEYQTYVSYNRLKTPGY